ncbi:MAG: hypothetical protein JXL97_10920 [Bacteroidales bacterium]|nr:hypothetical protein [Bacteroidales bacterium]
MKAKWHILLILMLTVTAFNYNNTYSFSAPSIKVSKIKIEKENVLCLQINISSIDYIESLIVESETGEFKNKRVFVFEKKTRRASVTYYYYGNYEDNLKFSLKFTDSLKNRDYEKILNINNI